LVSQNPYAKSIPKLGPEEGLAMENCVSDTVETGKTWVAPELKRVDVEELTAEGSGTNDDDGSFS